MDRTDNTKLDYADHLQGITKHIQPRLINFRATRHLTARNRVEVFFFRGQEGVLAYELYFSKYSGSERDVELM